MIKADKSQPVSQHVLKRSQTMSVERLGPTEFRVTPCEEGKLIRIVRFHQDADEGIWIECFAEETKESCPANSHNLFCSHCNAAIIKLLTDHQTEGESDEPEQN